MCSPSCGPLLRRTSVASYVTIVTIVKIHIGSLAPQVIIVAIGCFPYSSATVSSFSTLVGVSIEQSPRTIYKKFHYDSGKIIIFRIHRRICFTLFPAWSWSGRQSTMFRDSCAWSCAWSVTLLVFYNLPVINAIRYTILFFIWLH